jgi:hypothetical protein
MQASRSLSSEQFAALQSVFIFLEGVTTHLDVDNRPISDADVELTRTVLDMGRLCISKMLTAFPDLQAWRTLGDGGVQ